MLKIQTKNKQIIFKEGQKLTSCYIVLKGDFLLEQSLPKKRKDVVVDMLL
jgi:CRP-like cAMP-binding protein